VSENQKSCIVVGAGISGLLAASALQREGWDVTVLDKGRGVGGRMATRRVGEGTFDHGAQFFTVRGERFAGLVEGWLGAGVATEWARGFADAYGRPNEDGHPRYRGTEGMTSIPKYISRGLDVRTGERALRVDDGDDGWEVVCESGLRVAGDALVLGAPVPQALDLTSSGSYTLPDGARRQLEAVSYDPCVALMALLEGPTGVPEPGGMQIKGEPLDWIGDNKRKGISEAPCITVHAGPDWSRSHFEDGESEVVDSMISLVTGSAPTSHPPSSRLPLPGGATAGLRTPTLNHAWSPPRLHRFCSAVTPLGSPRSRAQPFQASPPRTISSAATPDTPSA
jgi:renalase